MNISNFRVNIDENYLKVRKAILNLLIVFFIVTLGLYVYWGYNYPQDFTATKQIWEEDVDLPLKTSNQYLYFILSYEHYISAGILILILLLHYLEIKHLLIKLWRHDGRNT